MAANTYVALATQTLASTTSSVTFTGISQDYTDLVLVVSARSTNGSGDDSMYFQVNSDTGSNYSWTRVLGNGSSASSYRLSSQTAGTFDGVAGGSTASGTYNTMVLNFQNYSNTSTYKTILGRSGTAGAYTLAAANLWRSTSAITSIYLTLAAGSFAAGSTFSIYGILAA